MSRLQVGKSHPLLPVALLAFAMAVPCLSVRAADTEAEQARSMAQLLEAGRVFEAVTKAEAAVQNAPESGLLRRRLAQAHLCQAIDLDNRLGKAFRQAWIGQSLTSCADFMRNFQPRPKAPEREREDILRLLGILEGEQAQELQAAGRRAVQEAAPLLQARIEAWNATRSDLKQAAQLGDNGTETRLTGLWARVIALTWLRERRELTTVREGQTRALDEETEHILNHALEPLTGTKSDDLLRDAVALAKEQNTDPSALAGAADLLSVVGPLAEKPDPLFRFSQSLLDGRYLKNRKSYVLQLWPNTHEAGRQQRRQALETQNPDPIQFHWVHIHQLYERALELDTERKLPLLRERVYLLRLPFDEPGAERILAEIAKQEPQNAVVPLERARKLLLLEEKFAEGMTELRRAAAMPRFSRSVLTAVPEPLRLAIKFHRQLRMEIGRHWPTFDGMRTTLNDALPEQRNSPEAVDLLLTRLRLDGLLSQSGDYLEQWAGINSQRSVLKRLRDPKMPLSASARAEVEARFEQHQPGYADFPKPPALLLISVRDGIVTEELGHPILDTTLVPSPYGKGYTLGFGIENRPDR